MEARSFRTTTSCGLVQNVYLGVLAKVDVERSQGTKSLRSTN